MTEKPRGVLCRLGLHAWRRETQPDGTSARECRRCGKNKADVHAPTGQPVPPHSIDGRGFG
jgi:hypothetical protein